jgi:hypothetical protein
MTESGKYQAAVGDQGIAILEAYRNGLEKIGRETEMIAGSDLPTSLRITSLYVELALPDQFHSACSASFCSALFTYCIR